VLSNLEPGCIAAAVTSPPYFNAREYSQWENMYLYYIDMYNIAKNTLRTLDKAGIFLYNIGDVNGNEMTIAKSNMGTKRLLLGAYSILAFEKAGYELVDNYIWNKGEPQSKRSTNDGNFTPHYQKPVNCYEHMFIFKRKGDELVVNEQEIPEGWKNFVVDFMPVFKINSKGENTVGHTAPYPEDIPQFAAKAFGKPGKYIMDPFLGSGTSIVSAVKCGYKGIGIEFSKEYAELAKRRFEEDVPGKTIQLL
jgi:DNA modification methylase